MLQEVASEGEQAAYRPPMHTWTPEVELLTQALDALKLINSSVIASAGVKPPEVKSSPRPRTALEYAHHNVAQSRHEELVARMKRLSAERDLAETAATVE